jgi:hypothetical protein
LGGRVPSFPSGFGFVVGLLLSGAALLVWAARSTYASSGTHSVVSYLTLFYVVVVVVALAWCQWWSTRRSVPVGPLTREEQGEREEWKVAFRNVRGFLTAVWFVLALVGCVPAWRAVFQVVRAEPVARFLDFTAPALTLGWTMVMAALITLLLVPVPSLAQARRPRVPLGGVAGLAVGAAIAALVFASTAILPVEATTARAPSPEDAAAPPTRVSGVGWRWRTPGGAGVVTTVAAGGGVAVLSEDAVVLLDTGTGEERWRYRSADERTGDVTASPDGGVLIVAFRAWDHTGQPRTRLVVFDAYTGRIRAEHQDPRRDEGTAVAGPSGQVSATATMYIASGLEEQEGAFEAFHLDSGEAAWRYEPPDGCHVREDFPRPAPEAVVVVMWCAGRNEGAFVYDVLVTGLDPVDGEELWRHEEVRPDGVREMRHEVSPDVGVLTLLWVTGGGEGGVENVYLRTGDGEELARDPEWSDLSLAEEGRGGAPRSLTRDGRLMYQYSGPDDEALRYAWFGFGGTERTASVDYPEWFSPDHAQFADVLVLQHMVVVAYPRASDERPPAPLAATVSAEPWEGAEGVEPARFDVEVDHGGDPMTTGQEWMSLRLAPGAVVLTGRGAQEVVGLQ